MSCVQIGLGSDNPRRIAYHPGLKMFGVACVHSGAPRIGDAEVSQSSFKLIDDVSLEREYFFAIFKAEAHTYHVAMGQFVCEPDEEITAVHALTDLNVGNRAVAFCVATVRDQLEGAEPTEGRLLIFALDQDGGVASPRATPRLVASTPTAGCTYALTIVHGMIAAAVNTSVGILILSDHLNQTWLLTCLAGAVVCLGRLRARSQRGGGVGPQLLCDQSGFSGRQLDHRRRDQLGLNRRSCRGANAACGERLWSIVACCH